MMNASKPFNQDLNANGCFELLISRIEIQCDNRIIRNTKTYPSQIPEYALNRGAFSKASMGFEL